MRCTGFPFTSHIDILQGILIETSRTFRLHKFENKSNCDKLHGHVTSVTSLLNAVLVLRTRPWWLCYLQPGFSVCLVPWQAMDLKALSSCRINLSKGLNLELAKHLLWPVVPDIKNWRKDNHQTLADQHAEYNLQGFQGFLFCWHLKLVYL